MTIRPLMMWDYWMTAIAITLALTLIHTTLTDDPTAQPSAETVYAREASAPGTVLRHWRTGQGDRR